MILWAFGLWPTLNLAMAGFSVGPFLLGLIPLTFAMEQGMSKSYRREGVEQAYGWFGVAVAFLLFGVVAGGALAAVVLCGIGWALWRSVGVLRGRDA